MKYQMRLVDAEPSDILKIKTRNTNLKKNSLLHNSKHEYQILKMSFLGLVFVLCFALYWDKVEF